MRKRRHPRHGVAAAILAGAIALAMPAAPPAGDERMPSFAIANVGATPVRARAGHRHHGVASYYASRFDGRRTASGEIYDEDALTAAHPYLPFGTRVRVIDRETGRAVVVRVNDRGPFVRGRTIDLSRRAGEVLGIVEEGLADVTIEVVGAPNA